MKVEEEGDTKLKMGKFPQALAVLKAFQIMLFELQNVQDEFPSWKHKEIGSTFHISKKEKEFVSWAAWQPGGLLVPPGSDSLEWLTPRTSCDSLGDGYFFHIFMFLNFFLLLKLTHLTRFLEQSFQSIKRYKIWGLVVN